MKTVQEVMAADVVCLKPSDTVKTAVMLVKGHGISCFPVIDGDAVIGLVDYKHLLGKDSDIQVNNLMDKEYLAVSPNMPVNDAGSLMCRFGVNYALVTDKDHLLGIVTSINLLSVLDSLADQEFTVVPVPEQLNKAVDTTSTGRLKIECMNLTWEDHSMAVCEIELSDGSTRLKQSRSGSALGDSVLRLIAEVTAEAVNGFLPSDGYGVVTDNVSLVRGNFQDEIVLVTVMFITPQKQLKLSGSALVKQGIYRATASALLDAINRQLSFILCR